MSNLSLKAKASEQTPVVSGGSGAPLATTSSDASSGTSVLILNDICSHNFHCQLRFM